MIKVDIVIIGAGIGGLSLGYFLKKNGIDSFIILEKEDIPGGLCRSYRYEDCCWDKFVHVLHSINEEEIDFIQNELEVELLSYRRNAKVIFNNSKDELELIDFPFQSYIHQIKDKETRKQCEKIFNNSKNVKSYKDWLLKNFGENQCKYFFFPYNKKLYGSIFEELVPQGSTQRIAAKGSFGYNQLLYYPEAGGIDRIPNAFYYKINSHVNVASKVININFKDKIVRVFNSITNSEVEIKYRKLFSYIPLPFLCSWLDDFRDILDLKYISLGCFTIIKDVSGFQNIHWIYTARKDDIYYRIVFHNSFSPNNSLKEKQIITFEYRLKDRIDLLPLIMYLTNDYVKAAFFDSVVVGYCAYTKGWKKNVESAKKRLKDFDCYSVGRYGGWNWYSMIDVIREAKQLANDVINSY